VPFSVDQLTGSDSQAAFGYARFKLKSLVENRAEYERLIEVFRAHNIGYFFYNGGNDSMDTAHKVSQISKSMGFPVACIGIPKTVDSQRSGATPSWLSSHPRSEDRVPDNE